MSRSDQAAPEVEAAEFPVLHRIRIKGRASEQELSAFVTEPGRLASLDEAGYVARTRVGFLLTEAGLARHDALLADERARTDRAAVETSYERFQRVNPVVKATCARWHTAHELWEKWDAIGALADQLGRVDGALRRVAEVLPRFDGYRTGLAGALERAEAGHEQYVVDPTLPSFHTLWFECHEDYLLTLGRTREEEGSY
ncbi:MAG: hypothetical protein QOD57_2334 [Actinomycetota bacterium]|jgi:hypothetical protein|nr:hypothetical protein [Actinomycetota bacterium]MDQ1504607.1 hypothetical protein [Actinomycetota bacterium]